MDNKPFGYELPITCNNHQSPATNCWFALAYAVDGVQQQSLVFGGKKEGTTVESEPAVEVMEEEKETSPEPNEPSAEQRKQQSQDF